MAVHVPVPDVAEVHVRATLHGQPVETCSWFRWRAGSMTQADLDGLVGRLRTAWNSFIYRQLGNDIVRGELLAVDISPGASLSSTTSVWSSTSLQGVSCPGSIAISLLPSGPTIPRPWQWRVRLFGVPEARVTADQLELVWASNLRVGFRDRYTLQGAFGWDPVVVQKVVSGVPLAVGAAYDISDYLLPTLVVSPMRRRLTPL